MQTPEHATEVGAVRNSRWRARPHFALWCLVLLCAAAGADDQVRGALAGEWRANWEESDDIDRAIEKVILERGGNIEPAPGKSRRDRGRYRGGPPDQALYDHLSYDDAVTISLIDDGFRFVHHHENGDLEREVGRSGAGRTVSARATPERKDYSFYYWDGTTLVVESRPRDSGRLMERYSLIPETGQLKVELGLSPSEFSGRLDVVRVYDRVVPPP